MVDVPEEIAGDLKNLPAHALTRVIFRRGATVNLGDFNSERIDVGLEPVCQTKVAKIDATYEWARDWVVERLDEELDRSDTDED